MSILLPVLNLSVSGVVCGHFFCFFGFLLVWFLFWEEGVGCGDGLVVWGMCLFLFKALGWNSVLLIASIEDDTS